MRQDGTLGFRVTTSVDVSGTQLIVDLNIKYTLLFLVAVDNVCSFSESLKTRILPISYISPFHVSFWICWLWALCWVPLCQIRLSVAGRCLSLSLPLGTLGLYTPQSWLSLAQPQIKQKRMVSKGEIAQINTNIQADTEWWYGFCSGMAIIVVLQSMKCYPRWIIICKEEQSTELSSHSKLFNFSFASQTKAWPNNKVQSAVSNPLQPCQIRLSLWLLWSSNGTHLAGRSCAVCSYTPRASS